MNAWKYLQMNSPNLDINIGHEMSDKDEYIRRLDKIERDLEWIIRYLLKKDVTIQPSPYKPPPADHDPTYWAQQTCSKCGMKWNGVMGYVCSNVDCPVQLKVR